MREKYESLALVQLKELAKVRGLKGTSGMKKAEIVEAMLAEDERLKKLEESTAESGEAQQASDSLRAEETAPENPVSESAESENNQSDTVKTPSPRTDNSRPAFKRVISTGRRPRQGVGTPGGERPQGVMNDGNYRAEGPAQADRSGDRIQERPQGDRSQGDRSQGDRPLGDRPLGDRSQGDRVQGDRPLGEGEKREEAAVGGQASQAAPAPRPRTNEVYDEKTYPKELDSGEEASGILEVMPDGYGFIRCENYLPGENDVYVAPSQIRRFGLKTGDILRGNKRIKTQQEKFSALLFIRTINGYTLEEASKRRAFEDMTPIFPDERIKLETPGCSVAMRVMDLVSPIGRGQRGMIVSPPKAGKTTLLKEVAKSILRTNPDMHMLILLIDERPEEVTDVKEAISGNNVEVIYSTFDELPDHHKRVSEMVIERAKRLVEHKKDVVILLDSITRLARAYNLVVPPSGRTLSGGLDPAALHMPKRFFGAARNMRGGGSLTILATALVDTGSKMDDVIYEEFKSTGNMEMILDRKLSEKRIFPAIDLAKSGTRREDLLLSSEELEAINIMRKALNGLKSDEATDRILDMFSRTRNNMEFVQMVKRNKFI